MNPNILSERLGADDTTASNKKWSLIIIYMRHKYQKIQQQFFYSNLTCSSYNWTPS